MWKIISLTLLGLSFLAESRPSYWGDTVLPAYEHHVDYAPTIIGHSTHALPAAISHQSQTIIHEKRPYLHPIVAHAPIIKTAYPAAHVVKTAYLPTESYGLPTVYSGGLYDHSGWSSSFSGWNPNLSGWIK